MGKGTEKEGMREIKKERERDQRRLKRERKRDIVIDIDRKRS